MLLRRSFVLREVREIGPTIVSKPEPVNATINQRLINCCGNVGGSACATKFEKSRFPNSKHKLPMEKQLDTRLEFAILTRESQF
jgi:hypothetical protein